MFTRGKIALVVVSIESCIRSVGLTTVARSAMFEGKIRATAVLNGLAKYRTCSLG